MSVNANGDQGYIIHLENDKSKSRLDSVYRLRNASISNRTSNGKNIANKTIQYQSKRWDIFQLIII